MRPCIFFFLALILLGIAAAPLASPAASQASATPPATPAPPSSDKPASSTANTPTDSTPASAPAQAPAAAPPAAGAIDTPAAGQAPPAAATQDNPDESVTTIRTRVQEVRLVFTVTDKHGRYINDLKKEDFKVLDDQKPAQLNSFRSETDLPLQVGLLIDASNSVRDRFKFEQEAAIEFLNAVIRPHYDTAFVVGFDVTPEVTQDFTDNTESLSVGVRQLRAGGGTAMFDALYFACRDKLLKRERTGPVRNAIILLSDGDDNASHVTREEAIDMAQRADAIVYTISTNISGMKGSGDKVLVRIADATGGRAFFPFQLREVSDAFVSIQEELRSQYAASYKPENFVADGRYRTIDVQTMTKGLKVRTRKGYYAPKP